MADYWGLRAICERMGWRSTGTPVKALIRTGFPILLRRRGSHPRLIYYTNDQLITAWEFALVRSQREELLKKREAGQGRGLGVKVRESD